MGKPIVMEEFGKIADLTNPLNPTDVRDQLFTCVLVPCMPTFASDDTVHSELMRAVIEGLLKYTLIVLLY